MQRSRTSVSDSGTEQEGETHKSVTVGEINMPIALIHKSERMHRNFKQYYQPAGLTYLHSGDTNRALKSAGTLPRYSKSQNKP